MTRRHFTTALAGAWAAAPAFSFAGGSAILRHYAPGARLEGAVRMDGPKVTAEWTGPGSAVWNIEIRHPDKYQVAIGYACGEPGSRLELRSAAGSLTATTRATAGVFTDPLNNVE